MNDAYNWGIYPTWTHPYRSTPVPFGNIQDFHKLNYKSDRQDRSRSRSYDHRNNQRRSRSRSYDHRNNQRRSGSRSYDHRRRKSRSRSIPKQVRSRSKSRNHRSRSRSIPKQNQRRSRSRSYDHRRQKSRSRSLPQTDRKRSLSRSNSPDHEEKNLTQNYARYIDDINKYSKAAIVAAYNQTQGHKILCEFQNSCERQRCRFLHLSPTSYVCFKCEMSFVYPPDTKRHMKTVHGFTEEQWTNHINKKCEPRDNKKNN